jgi:hypothetical protein
MSRLGLRRRKSAEGLPEKDPDSTSDDRRSWRTKLFSRFGGSKASNGAHAGEHHEASMATCVLSGLICGLMMFVFCCVFAEMVFGQNALLRPDVPLGVSVQTLTAMLGAFAFARFSGCHAIMAGPDINPLVFIAETARVISEGLLASCDGGDGSGSASGSFASCPSAMESAVPTVLVAGAIGTLLVGMFFFFLGKMRLTVVVGFIPANVISGFLACIGWKVLKAAIQIACPISVKKPFKFIYYSYYLGSWESSWRYLLPALPVGIPLYLLKRWHYGKPTVNFPLFITVPTALFYVVVRERAPFGPPTHMYRDPIGPTHGRPRIRQTAIDNGPTP